MLYILGQNGVGANVVYRYDPAANSGNGSVIGTPYTDPTVLVLPEDIAARPPHVYIATGSSANPVIQLLIEGNSFSLASTYGALGSVASPGVFYGPR